MADVDTLCRLVVVTPSGRVELALPTDVVIAELLPTVVRLGGEDLAEAGIPHGGWVLQRLDGSRLDGEQTLRAAGLVDGEHLHLRPYYAEIPAVHFDDMVDGVVTAMAERSDTWRPAWTRALLLTWVAAALTLLGLLLTGAGRPGTFAALALGVVLLGAAAAVARARVHPAAAGVLATGGTAYLSLGVTVFAPDAGAALLLAGLAVVAAALVAVPAVGARIAPVFTAACLIGGQAALAGVVLLVGATAAGAAAIVAVTAVVVNSLLPATAFRLAGLRMPMLPADAGQLAEEVEPLPDSGVRRRTARADVFLNWLYLASGAVEAACLFVLSSQDGWWTFALTSVLTLRLLLHALVLRARWQRLAAALPGSAGVVLILLDLVARTGPIGFLVIAGALIAASAGLVVASHYVPGRRFVPYWGRAADLAHTVAAAVTVPLMLQVLGLYGLIRSVMG
ncbi:MULTISPECIES: type VII secretion integral membrane protein EccD [unclassified Solwaraspora]|uniref:type VII secretion integral membrane protein EccD n=1 Tax=unclassified Solwaraspora TaxID=2627926 RepID=UPI00259B0C2E|nr:type VII secretion integral membrane protein EccD [Solwaraspora sp. WMMA2056]WJK38780.1 type VII secretion integral membrane protein EccD [Solwaraspora sp. WMMA2056]